MSSWVVIPCLLALRDEFNQISPNRDKGADGTIGDSNHTSSSDHTPDEDSSKLENKDSDHKNEVHALDIDSSGPWPAGRSFKSMVMDVIAGEKAKWLDANDYVQSQARHRTEAERAESDRRWCALLTELDNAYATSPGPTTEVGKKVAAEIHQLRVGLGCPEH
jgi:hypothetical protein